MTKTITKTTKTFANHYVASDWAKTYARENMHPFHFWKVEEVSRDLYVVAIRSKNDGRLNGYAY